MLPILLIITLLLTVVLLTKLRLLLVLSGICDGGKDVGKGNLSICAVCSGADMGDHNNGAEGVSHELPPLIIKVLYIILVKLCYIIEEEENNFYIYLISNLYRKCIIIKYQYINIYLKTIMKVITYIIFKMSIGKQIADYFEGKYNRPTYIHLLAW